ncbi:PIR protein [Plasmodium ovale]|uniref:PIR protein n=1 Tax=Plasmodium ovale TaxID=36330 RepID=A0A1D3JC27_PLAOA|nr:PIR protein [Plasmodium ovale]
MHDFSSDCGNHKIDLANPNAPCNANYKNYLYNYVDNYKKFYSYCEIVQKTDKHCEEFHKFFGDKKHGELSILSLKDTITQLDLADCTFPEGRSPPQSDKSITRHSQIIAGVTFSALILLTLFILYNFSPVGTRIQKFLSTKGIMGFKLNNLQTIEMTKYASENEHTNFDIRRINIAYHSA